MRRATTGIPGLGRTVAGVAVGGVLAAGLMVNVAGAAEYTCPTFTDPSGDTSPAQPGEPDVDIVAVTYTVANGRFQAKIKVDDLDTGLSGSGPALGSGDIFRTTFSVADKAVSMTFQRDFAPTATTPNSTVVTVAGKNVPGSTDLTEAETVTISALVDDLTAAAETTLVGQPVTQMKASTTTVSPIPNTAISDSAAAAESVTYTFGDVCAAPAPTDSPSETESPSPDPSDTASPDPSSTSSPSPTATSTPGTGLGGYVAMPTPVRVLDTRSSSRVGTVIGPVDESATFSLAGQITGTATAAVLNVTSVGSTAPGNLVVHRTATAKPGTSSLNWAKGVTQANEVVTALDETKSVTIDVNSTGSTHVVVDLVGYVTADPNVDSAGLIALKTPERVFDQTVEEGATTITLQPSQLRTGTTGVRVNVTLVRPATSTFLAVYPGDEERPSTSTVNAATGATQSNETFVRLAADRSFKVDLGLGVARVVVDLLGTYGKPVTSAGTVQPLENPSRLVDTRNGTGAPTGKRTSGSSLAVPLPSQLPAGTVGVVLEVTSTQANDQGFVTVHPGGTSRPNTSTLNLTSRADRAHQVVVGRGTGNPLVSVGGGGTTHVVVDLVGYVVDPTVAPTASPSPSDSETPDPSASPSESVDPSASPDPSASASEDPSASPDPSESASESPSPSPSPTTPSPTPESCAPLPFCP